MISKAPCGPLRTPNAPNLRHSTASWITMSSYSGIVRPGRDPAAAPGPVRMEKPAARLVHALVSVGAEEVPLGLQQIRRQARGAVSIVERKCGRERRRGYPELDRLNQGAAPGILVAHQRLAEKIILQQIRELRILIVGFSDFPEEAAANNTATAPHQGDAAKIQIPLLLFRGLTQQHVSLRVRNHL